MAAEEHGVALLGAGIFAKTAHLPAVAASPLVIRAVYSRSQASAVSLAEAGLAFPTVGVVDAYWDVPSEGAASSKESGDLEALLSREDIQTVILSLPILVQPDVIRKAFAAGKHVISEKPIAKDVAAAKALITLWETEYKPRGIFWIIAEQYPYEPSFVKAKQLIEAGQIGTLRSFAFDFNTFVVPGSKYVETSWRKVPEYQGGFCLDGGVHWAAGLRYMLPTALTSLTASTDLIQEHLPPVDTIHGLLKTASGAPGTFTISFGTETCTKRSYSFYGSKASLVVDVENQIQVTTLKPLQSTAPAAAGVVDALVIEVKGSAVEEEFMAFARALIEGPQSVAAKDVDARSGPRAALLDLQFIEAAIQSGQSGAWVDLTL